MSISHFTDFILFIDLNIQLISKKKKKERRKEGIKNKYEKNKREKMKIK